MDSSKQPKSVISFCSGYAGIERGLELAGVAARALAYVEIEAFAAANLVAKMEANALAPAPIWSNLKTFPAHLFRDRVDILTGGYPCQPFSAAGKRAGKDDPRHLWPWIREHIKTMRPVRCFFENVEGHISLGLREVIEDLEGLGYETTWGIFSASEVGAPHQRKRVYILAHAKRDPIRQQSRWRSGENGQSAPFPRVDGEPQPLADATGAGLASGKRSRVGAIKKKNKPGLVTQSERRGVEVADADNARQQPSERQGQARYDVGGSSQELADADSERQPGWPETNGRQTRQSVEGSAKSSLADSNDPRREQSNQEDAGRSSEQFNSSGFSSGDVSDSSDRRRREVPTVREQSSIELFSGEGKAWRARTVSDSNSERLERRLYGSSLDAERWKEQEVRRSTECGDWGGWNGHQGWAFEPRLGRVVDGCADRVDRLRLLGNGVVPQTAAQAWTILNEKVTG